MRIVRIILQRPAVVAACGRRGPGRGHGRPRPPTRQPRSLQPRSLQPRSMQPRSPQPRSMPPRSIMWRSAIPTAPESAPGITSRPAGAATAARTPIRSNGPTPTRRPRFVSVACSGATTADVLSSQVSALSASTTLVSITIGGNDAGFSSVMETCVLGSTSTCVNAVDDRRDASSPSQLPARLDTDAGRRSGPTRRTRRSSCSATPTCTTCPSPARCIGLSTSDRTALNQGADDPGQRPAGRRAGQYDDTFADVRGPVRRARDLRLRQLAALGGHLRDQLVLPSRPRPGRNSATCPPSPRRRERRERDGTCSGSRPAARQDRGASPPRYRRETGPGGMIIERDVPVPVRGGVTVYADVFRPADGRPAPPLIAWSPVRQARRAAAAGAVPGRRGGARPAVAVRGLRVPRPGALDGAGIRGGERRHPRNLVLRRRRHVPVPRGGGVRA